MALGDTDITTNAVESELGLAITNSWSNLVGYSGINKYSRYSPGTLTVDGNKNIVLSLGSPYKLADFRRYNHASIAPSFWSMGTQNHSPGTTVATVIIQVAMETLNLQAFATNGIDTGTNPAHYHIRVDVYTNSTDRINQTGTVQSFYPIGVNMVAHTPLTGHTRQISWVMNTGYSGNQITCTNVNVSLGDCIRYCDVYFCDSSGANRIINFGTSISAGYYDISFHESIAPAIIGGANYAPPPSGGTTSFARVHTSSTPVCTDTSRIAQSPGGTTFSFYVKAKAVVGGSTRVYDTISGEVRLTYKGITQTIYSGALSYTAGTLCSGTLASSQVWQYDYDATITLYNISWGSNYTSC